MAEKRKKIILLNTLLLIFCCVVIALFCWSPKQEVVLEKYKINFETEGGSSVAAIEIEEGQIPKKPKDPTRDGYVFVGWMLGDELYDFTTTVDGDVTLKAIWKELDPDKKYYIITIDIGDGVTSSQPVEEGGIPIPPTTPTREGYNFLGWEINGEPYDFTTPVTEDATIVAKWEEVQTEPDPDEDKEYTVHFNLNGGTGNAPDQVVKHGQRATAPANPTRDGFTFNGWSPNINTAVTREITFTAQWKKVDVPVEPPTVQSWRVSYRFNGATVCSSPAHFVEEGKPIVPQCDVTIPPHSSDSGWSCNGVIMPQQGITCNRTSTLHNFTVTCTPVGDALSATTCTLSLFENNNPVSATLSINGRQVAGAISISGMWEKVNEVQFTLSDGFSGTAHK